MQRRAIDRRQLAVALLACALMAGCAQCRLPRIDPTGERIFAPAPAPGAEPTSPSQVPGRRLPWDPIQVIVSPGVAVAAVRSEVVLVASVLGPDGYLRTNERVEWSVAPGGVGEILEFDRQGICDLLLGDFTWPRRVTNTFAIGSTSRDDLRLTRATPDPTDDVLVRRGQTWVTATSAVEGTSCVTAYAPDVHGWDRHKQTATIHWIDAQWQFPPPAVNPAGGRHALVTTVGRSTDQSPQAGWLVQYRIQGGPPAGFVPDGAQAIEVPTDAMGQARAEIFQPQPAAGTNSVVVQVIRPGQAGGLAGSRVAVGQGSTLVTWTAPGLAVRVGGPGAAAVGATLVYRLEVTNSGDLPSEGVVLSTDVARGLSYLNSAPAATVLGSNLQWQLGRLTGGECRYVDISVRADQAATVSQCAEATAASGLRARDCATTTVSVGPPAGLAPGYAPPATPAYPPPAAPPSGYPLAPPATPGPLSPPSGFGVGQGGPSAGHQPALQLTVTGPAAVTVGDEAKFEIIIANVGASRATGIELVDRFDEGLVHQRGGRAIGLEVREGLAPGELKRVSIAFQAVKAGLLCHTAELKADGGFTTSRRACVTAVEGRVPGAAPVPGPSPPAGAALPVSIRIVPPQSAVEGQKARFLVELSNTGYQALNDVEVRLYFDPALSPQNASQNQEVAYVVPEKAVLWTLPMLLPSRPETASFECLCLKAAPKAGLQVRVTSREGGPAEQTSSVTIASSAPAGAGPTPTPGPGGTTAPAASGLKATIIATKNPVEAGWELTYYVTISNTGTDVERDIDLTVTLPPELTISRLKTLSPTIQPAGTTAAEAWPEFKDQKVSFGRLSRLDPDQEAEYRIGAQVKTVAQDTVVVAQDTVVTVEARVTAKSLPAGAKIVSLKTTINAPRAAKP